METTETSFVVNTRESREKFFRDLYERAFPAFARFAAKMNGSFQDAKDVFQDALIVYYEKQEKPDFFLRTTPDAYVLGIARHLLFRKLDLDGRSFPLDPGDSELSVSPDYFPDARELSLLKFLERTGKKCLDLLHHFYYEKSSLKDIASFLGYRTEHSAAVQKFKCIGKLRDAIKSKSIQYEDFHF